MTTFGERLQEAITNAGRTRAEVASAIGCTVQAIGLCVTGNNASMSAENTARAARYLGCDVFWLATGELEDDSISNPSANERNSVNGMKLIGKISTALEKQQLSSLQIEIIDKLLVAFTGHKA